MKKNTFKKMNPKSKRIGFITLFAVYQNSHTVIPNLIVVSKDLVAKKTNLTTWENQNRAFYHDDNSGAGNACLDNVLIDLNKVSNTDGKMVKTWLKDNSDFICYMDAYQYIERAHIITDQDFINNIDNATEQKELTYDSIKNKINVEINDQFPNIDFDSHGYEGYINFESLFDNNTKYFYDSGDIEKDGYSIPFFRSIKNKVQAQLNGTVEERDITFTFVIAKNHENKDVNAFIMNATNGSSNVREYYNFSTDPGKPSSYK